MKIAVLNNQTLLDIAIRYFGTVEAVLAIAILNGISITEELVPGQTLELPNIDFGFQEVVAFFEVNKIQPATALTQEESDIIEGATGIGFWIIGNNFIVQ